MRMMVLMAVIWRGLDAEAMSAMKFADAQSGSVGECGTDARSLPFRGVFDWRWRTFVVCLAPLSRITPQLTICD